MKLYIISSVLIYMSVMGETFVCLRASRSVSVFALPLALLSIMYSNHLTLKTSTVQRSPLLDRFKGKQNFLNKLPPPPSPLLRNIDPIVK